jgi:hypothetical protein
MNQALTSLAVVAALGLAASVGCVPCEERCRVESRVYEDCLGDWGLEWADLGAEDRADFRRQCLDQTRTLRDGQDAAARSEDGAFCSDLVTNLRAAGDCGESWEALVAYGAEP